MDKPTEKFVRRVANGEFGPVGWKVLDIGGRRFHGQWTPRGLFLDKGSCYQSIDLSAGENVDHVGDVRDFAKTEAGKFSTVLCLNTIEHDHDPSSLVAAMKSLLSPGGLLVLAAPWVFAEHDYPDDYWRVSVHGMIALFAGAGMGALVETKRFWSWYCMGFATSVFGVGRKK